VVKSKTHPSMHIIVGGCVLDFTTIMGIDGCVLDFTTIMGIDGCVLDFTTIMCIDGCVLDFTTIMRHICVVKSKTHMCGKI
jgi:hypothetical protein